MKTLLLEIRAKAQEALANANDDGALESIRVGYLGKKGELTAVLRGMGKLTPEERPIIGQLANEVRSYIEDAIAVKKTELEEKKLEEKLKAEKLDVTAPGKKFEVGTRHPLEKIETEMSDIFRSM